MASIGESVGLVDILPETRPQLHYTTLETSTVLLTYPCFDSTLRTIDNFKRHTSYVTTESEQQICDISLLEGWYRFKVNGTNAEIPTSCVQPHRCGTSAPIWINVDKQTFPAPGTQENVQACTSWDIPGRSSECCLFKFPVVLKNCGSFYAYYLQSIGACAVAYCVQEQTSKCPDHQLFDWKTRVCEDIEIDPPVLSTSVEGKSVILECRYKESDSTPVLHVKWTKYMDNDLKVDLNKHNRRSLIVGEDVFPGDTVSCSIGFIVKDTNQEKLFSSKRLFIGLKFTENPVILNEGEVASLKLISTIPIICRGDASTCSLGIHIKASHKDIQFPNCSIKLHAKKCTGDNCGQVSIPITVGGVLGYNFDKRTSSIQASVVDYTSDLWRNVKAESKLSIKDAVYSLCTIYGDPYIYTFDKRSLQIQEVGSFVLFENKRLKQQVTIQIWELASRRKHVCGFHIHDGGDIVSVNMCDGQGPIGKALVTLDIKSGRKGMKIYEGEKNVMVSVPSSFRIHASLENWGMTLALWVPNSIIRLADGICLSRDMGTELKSQDESRLLQKEYHERRDNFHCSCMSDRTKDECGAIEYPNELFISNFIDTTKQHTHLVDSFKPLKRSQVEKDLFTENYDNGSLVLQTEEMDPQKKALNRKLCADTINSHPIMKACQNYLNQRHAFLVETCALECSNKGDDISFESFHAVIEVLCEDEILQNKSHITSSSNTRDAQIVIFNELRLKIRCPDDCQRRGLCTKTGCLCEKGYRGKGCEEKIDFKKEAERIRSKTKRVPVIIPSASLKSEPKPCDRQRMKCDVIEFTITSANAIDLECRLTPLKYHEYNWKPLNITFYSIPTQNSLETILCSYPSYRQLRNTMEYGDSINKFLIEVLDKERNILSSIKSVVYDSKCQTCSLDSNKPCKVKADACLIWNTCYAANQYNPDNSCELCNPDEDSYRWSEDFGNKPPYISPTYHQVVAYKGDVVQSSFHAWDTDEDIFTFSVNRKEAHISNKGHFKWNTSLTTASSGPRRERFTIKATDKCNKHAVAILEVLVLTCECQNGGSCGKFTFLSQKHPDYECICPNGFDGRRCERVTDLCYSNPCAHGKCVSNMTDYWCNCFSTHKGKHCNERINACDSKPCIKGTCENKGDSFRCRCDPGYEGILCETAQDLCKSNPCYRDVDCSSSNGFYKCGSCPEGMTGDGRYCKDIDDCAKSPCFPGVECIDLSAPKRGYVCGNCPRFFTGNGTDCQRTVNDSACPHNVCFSQSNCTESDIYPGFICGPCPNGLHGNGINCSALCDPPCPTNRVCTEHNHCSCKEGYMGYYCNIPVCTPYCKNHGTCIAPNKCRCRYGYKGDRCQKAQCRLRCKNGGTCLGRNICLCPHGYTGRRCQHKKCTKPCKNGGVCTRHNKCRCRKGYTGIYCEKPKCNPPCRNNGRCIKPGHCSCRSGYVGKVCERALCHPPCQNGGLCKRKNTCKCTKSYTGDRCQNPVCRLPCQNGGRCVGPQKCSCPSGWRGRRCQTPVCNISCKLGGYCFRPGMCSCPRGYGGGDCSQPLCRPRCKHGGKCIKPNKCKCRGRYSGRYCQNDRYNYYIKFYRTRSRSRNRLKKQNG